MPFQVADFKKKTKSVDFVFLDEPVHLEVRFINITPALLAEVQDLSATNAADASNLADRTAQLVIDLVAAWDIMEGDQMYPLDVERLKTLEIPWIFQMRVMSEAIQVLNAGEAIAG